VRGLLCAVLLGLAAQAAEASDFTEGAIGTTGSQFLTQDLGARGIALGGAYSALTDDADSLYWNPAGLSKVPRFSSNLTYSQYAAGINYQAASAASRVMDNGVFAAGFRYQDYGAIDHVDVAGNTVGTFHPRDYIGEIGWGEAIPDLSDNDVDVSMGVAARWIHSELLKQADAAAGDIGIQTRYYHGSRSYDFSFVAQNIGSGQKFDKVRESLPSRLRLGAAAGITPDLSVTLESIMPSNNIAQGAVGLEYRMKAEAGMQGAFRAGFNSLTARDLGIWSGVSLGFGITISQMSFDYAYTSMGVLGNQIHRISVRFNLPAKLSKRYESR
jgi:hypothetical protein